MEGTVLGWVHTPHALNVVEIQYIVSGETVKQAVAYCLFMSLLLKKVKQCCVYWLAFASAAAFAVKYNVVRRCFFLISAV